MGSYLHRWLICMDFILVCFSPPWLRMKMPAEWPGGQRCSLHRQGGHMCPYDVYLTLVNHRAHPGWIIIQSLCWQAHTLLWCQLSFNVDFLPSVYGFQKSFQRNLFMVFFFFFFCHLDPKQECFVVCEVGQQRILCRLSHGSPEWM